MIKKWNTLPTDAPFAGDQESFSSVLDATRYFIVEKYHHNSFTPFCHSLYFISFLFRNANLKIGAGTKKNARCSRGGRKEDSSNHFPTHTIARVTQHHIDRQSPTNSAAPPQAGEPTGLLAGTTPRTLLNRASLHHRTGTLPSQGSRSPPLETPTLGRRRVLSSRAKAQPRALRVVRRGAKRPLGGTRWRGS